MAEYRKQRRRPSVTCDKLIAALRKHGTYHGAGREVGVPPGIVHYAFTGGVGKRPRCRKHAREAQSIVWRTGFVRRRRETQELRAPRRYFMGPGGELYWMPTKRWPKLEGLLWQPKG